MTDEVARLEEEYHALGSMRELGGRKNELQETIRENKRQMQSINVRSIIPVQFFSLIRMMISPM